MNYAIALLAVIAILEATRLILTHRSVSRRAHFKQKLEGTTKMIWDLEFKVFKTREIKEDIRQEYDFMLSRIENFKKVIAEWPKEGSEDERKRIEDQLALAERDRDRLLAQIKQLDREIEGARPTVDDPDGATGVVEQIESLRELQGMLRDYIRTL